MQGLVSHQTLHHPRPCITPHPALHQTLHRAQLQHPWPYPDPTHIPLPLVMPSTVTPTKVACHRQEALRKAAPEHSLDATPCPQCDPNTQCAMAPMPYATLSLTITLILTLNLALSPTPDLSPGHAFHTNRNPDPNPDHHPYRNHAMQFGRGFKMCCHS